MRQRHLIGLITAAALALPTAASAYIISIAGYDPVTTTAPPAGPPGPNPNNPYPSVFVGLGNCGTTSTTPAVDNSCQAPPIGINNLNNQAAVDSNNALFGLVFPHAYTYAAIAGFGFKLDQVIFHPFNQTTSGGTFQQGFDFVVGSTGGGSAGPFASPFSLDYLVDLARDVTVSNDANTNSVTHLIHQTARLTISWGDEDTLMIYASNDPVFGTMFGGSGMPEEFNLGADGKVFVTLGRAGPVTQGDPDTDVIITSINAVPLPSTLAMFSLGLVLAGFVRAKHRTLV